MGKKRNLSFVPDYAIPPGETLGETLESLGMSASDLAVKTGLPLKSIRAILNGSGVISEGAAEQFEKAMGIPASFWLNLELNHQKTKFRLGVPRKKQESVHAKLAASKPVAKAV